MKRLKEDLLFFLKCKWYILGLAVTAVLSYGYAVTHFAIGMDDTAVSLYYDDGLAPYVGRWSLFIINKFLHISEFAPWMVEFVSVLLLMLSVTLWCVLWKRICEPGVMIASGKYALVAGVFLSCPLISEIFVFYLHNGVCTGYGVTALGLIAYLDSLGKNGSRVEVFRKLMLSAVLLTIALGFYESFIIIS